MFTDIVNHDAFTQLSLTAAITKGTFVPQQLATTGLWQEAGTMSPTALIEELQEIVGQAPVKPRGAPGTVVLNDKRKLRSVVIPHIPQVGRITADEIRNLRAFGSDQQTESLTNMRDQQLAKMRRKIDTTREAHRLLNLKNKFIDANGDEALLSTFFGVSAPASISLALNSDSTKVLDKCAQIIDAVEAALDETYEEINVQCDPTMWGPLISHPKVMEVYLGYAGAAERAGNILQSFVFGNIRWHRYRGTSASRVGEKRAYAYPTGVDNMFITRFAPSTWLDSLGVEGLPYYARARMSEQMDAVILDSQSNPVNMCTRPNAVIELTTP